MRSLTVLLTMALGSASAPAQIINCAGVAEVFNGRLAISTGAMDEGGAFALLGRAAAEDLRSCPDLEPQRYYLVRLAELGYSATGVRRAEGRSEEHTSELQSRENLVCRLLLEKQK